VSNEDNRADVALTSSEQELRLVAGAIPALVWTAGPEGNVEYVNKRVLEYFGAPLDEIIGWGWMEKVHPDDVAFKVSTWLRNLESGNPHDAVCRMRGADGRYRWFEVRAEPLRASDGTVLSWCGVLIDIDDRRKAENRLRRSEAHLAEAQRLSHTGSVVYNETTILYWSGETYRIWGFDPLQGIPSHKAVWKRIHPDDRDRAREEAEHALRERRGHSIAYRIVLPDGTAKHLESTSQPVFSASGKLVEVVATQVDVTERKRAEQALRESEYKLRQIVETVPSLLWSLVRNPVRRGHRFRSKADSIPVIADSA
jgi:PAS domain S-box-containing protein